MNKYKVVGAKYVIETGTYHIRFDHMVAELTREEFEELWDQMMDAFADGLEKKTGSGL